MAGYSGKSNGKGWADGAGYGEKILAILAAISGTTAGAGSGSAVSASGFPAVPFLVKVIVPDLNIRKSLSSADNSNLTGKVTGIGKFTIVEVSGKWGLLKSYKENQCFDV